MPRILIAFFALIVISTTVLRAQSYKEAIVPFYSETIKLAYSSDMLAVEAPTIQDEALVNHFQALSGTNYKAFLNSIRQVAKAFNLNDWMHYQLMQKSLEVIYEPGKEKEKELAMWFMLSQLGFDTRLAYLNNDIFLFVHSKEEVFETPLIEDQGRIYINLSSIGKGKELREALYLLNFIPNPSGKAFSFEFQTLPALRPLPKEQVVKFWLDGKWEKLEVKVDSNLGQLMDGYPVLREQAYMDIPLSKLLAQSLLPQLRKRIEGKSDWEAVRILAAFTRSAFNYKDDKEHFGSSKPMAAEEVFLYPYSDCEDRSALFYNLVKELLGLPMVVIAYSNHLTIGVSLPQTRPGAFYHQGKPYYICDPTGPVKSSEIGIAPNGYEKAPFKILMATED